MYMYIHVYTWYVCTCIYMYIPYLPTYIYMYIDVYV